MPLTVAQRLLDGAVCALLSVIVVVTLAQVLARYVFGASFIWSEEFTRLLHVWMVMLAAVKAAHMRIDMLKDALPPPGRLALELFASLVALIVLVVLVTKAYALARFTAGDRYTGLDLSVMWVFVAVVAGGSLWGLAILGRTLALFRR